MTATIRLLRSFILAFLAVISAIHTAFAHEVRPAIADVTISEDHVSIDFALNLESFLANVDLSMIENIDASEKASDYDLLRTLSPEELRSAFEVFWPEMEAQIKVLGAGEIQNLTVAALEIPEVGDVELPRESRLVLESRAESPVQIGWAESYGSLILRQTGIDESIAFTGMLSGGELSPPIGVDGAVSEGPLQTFTRYIAVGFDHIIPKGLDHILFVLGLFFLAPRIMPLFWQVSAFTLAHTITLAAGALGYAVVPASIVEPVIAASIVYVAVENIFTSGLSPWRPAVIFCFGLLHGLGFASVLGEFGLPETQFIPALVGFNVGVEVGQIAVIAIAFLLVGWFRNKTWYRKAIAIPASCVIALIGAYWAIERTLL